MGASQTKSNFATLVTRLGTVDVDASDHAFWDELWKTPLGVEVFVLPVNDFLTIFLSFSSSSFF